MPVSPDLYLVCLATIGVFFTAPPGPNQVLKTSTSLTRGVSRSAATVAGVFSSQALQMIAAAGLLALRALNVRRC